MLSKYSGFFNNLMNNGTKPSLYLELIENGVIFIFPSMKDAISYHKHIDLKPETVSMVKNTIEDTYLKKIFVKPENFPKNGFVANISTYPVSYSKNFFKILKDTYAPSGRNAIKLHLTREKQIRIKINDVKIVNGFFCHILNHYFLKQKPLKLETMVNG